MGTLCLAGTAGAGVITVNPGDSIQVAIAVSTSGDIIEVNPGTYVEKIDMMGRDVTLRSTGGPAVTILDVTGLGAAPGAVVTCRLAEGPDTVIEGFTFTGGTGDTSLVAELGGGMFLSSTSPTVIDCVFTGNSAVLGGGLYAFFGASPILLDCVFEGNDASLSGGAVGAQSGSTIEIVNCRFTDNTSLGDAGALFFSESLPIVANCVFDGNDAATVGGAICNVNSELPLFVNCSFYDNQATLFGGAVYDSETSGFLSSSTMVNCIVWGNSTPQLSGSTDLPVGTFSNVEGGLAGTGNINVDPMFVNAAGGDLHLRVGSPSVDAGDDSSLPTDGADADNDANTAEILPVDFDGADRIFGNAVDMGAFELNAISLIGGTAGDDFGLALQGLGDVNGDGTPDFAIGMPGVNGDRGFVAVYSGETLAVIWQRQGPAAGDMFGFALGRATDLNGDGRDELIVGAPGSDINGTDSGRVFVYSGASNQQLRQRKGKEPGDGFGYAVAGGVDVNNDGTDDILVGAPFNDDKGVDAGLVDVLSGTSSFYVIARRKGSAAGDNFGFAVTGVGNGEGTAGDDFAVGAPFSDQNGVDAGKVVVFRGGAGVTGVYAAVGQNAGDGFGHSLCRLGDVDGDTLEDFAVGAPFWNGGRGRVYAYRASERLRLWIRSGGAGNGIGETIAAAGDLDCDGRQDVMAGGPSADLVGIDSGIVRLYSGASGTPLGALFGDVAGAGFGRGVAALGQDGEADYMIGAPGGGPGGVGAVTAHSSNNECP